jgi:branched-chain amino acid aminotransferase
MASVPFDQLQGVIWVDGSLVDWQDAKIHILSHGLHYGGSVFEGERAYGGKIFKSRQHSERFLKSAELLDFVIPYTVDQLIDAKQLVVDKNGFKNPHRHRCLGLAVDV